MTTKTSKPAKRVTTFEIKECEVVIRPSSRRVREWLASFCADRRWAVLANAAAECALYGGAVSCAFDIAMTLADAMIKAGFGVDVVGRTTNLDNRAPSADADRRV